MARPWVLVSLLLLIVFTSQLEWKQQFGNEIEASPNISQRDQQQQLSSNREEVVKEKVSFFILFLFWITFGAFFVVFYMFMKPEKVKRERPSCFFLTWELKILFRAFIYTRIWSSGFHRRIWESFIVFCVFGKSGSVLEFQICKLGKHNNAIWLMIILGAVLGRGRGGKTNWVFFFFLVLSPGCIRISAEDNYLCFDAFW
jgi:hypothetical protein